MGADREYLAIDLPIQMAYPDSGKNFPHGKTGVCPTLKRRPLLAGASTSIVGVP